MKCHSCKEIITGDYEVEQFIGAVWYWCEDCWDESSRRDND